MQSDSGRYEANETTRRDFLKRSTVAAVAGLAGLAPTAAQAASEAKGKRIGVGFIGAGGRSHGHMSMVQYLKEQENFPVDLIAVCDVYRPRMEQKKDAFKMPRGTMNYKELLEDPEVDLVCIATPDHIHGYQAIDALQAGKDVYCEKPVTHWRQFDLTKRLNEVVTQSDRVFQLGTQAMSDSAWHQMKALVLDGLIGQPIYGETGFFRIGDWGERNMPVDDPNIQPGPDLDWEAFLGDSPERPFSVDRFFRWRLFEDYAGGPVTDLFPHCLTQVIDILGVGFPDTVVATGGIHRYSYALRDVPDTFNMLAQYPENVTIAVLGTNGNDHNTLPARGSGQRSPVIRGWDGTLTIENNKNILFTPVSVKGAKEPRRFPIERAEHNLDHWKNLIACCQNRGQRPWSPMDLAFKTQTALQMAMWSWKQGKVARFDQEHKVICI